MVLSSLGMVDWILSFKVNIFSDILSRMALKKNAFNLSHLYMHKNHLGLDMFVKYLYDIVTGLDVYSTSSSELYCNYQFGLLCLHSLHLLYL